MPVIRLGEQRPVPATRRVRLGPVAMVALQRALGRTGTGLRLPEELRVRADDPTADLAGVDLAGVDLGAELAEATTALVEHGVLDVEVTEAESVPVDAVLANLASLVAAPYRVRTSLAGGGQQVLAHHWVDAHLGGGLVRDDGVFELALFDARRLGEELVGLLPDADHPDPAPGRGFTLPLSSLARLGALADQVDADAEVAVAVAELLGPDADAQVRRWAREVRAVLHLTVPSTDPERLPGMLVWFLGRDGWWSARTSTPGTDPRTVTLDPVRRRDLGAAVGSLVEGAWL